MASGEMTCTEFRSSKPSPKPTNVLQLRFEMFTIFQKVTRIKTNYFQNFKKHFFAAGFGFAGRRKKADEVEDRQPESVEENGNVEDLYNLQVFDLFKCF